MDTEILPVDISQPVAKEHAQVHAKAISPDREKEQEATVDTSDSRAQTITDPNLGQNIDLLE